VLHHAVALRLLALHPARLIGVVWRTLVASAAMAAAVPLLPEPAEGFLPMALALALEAGVGAAVFAACLLALWGLSGRPDGAESRLLAGAPWPVRAAAAGSARRRPA
jgi:hypothetical protein